MELKKPDIVSETFTPHWDMSLSNEQYHADRSAVSSTSLKLLIEKSPKAFLASHNGLMRKESDAFRIGTALHMAILEPQLFEKSFVIMPKFSGTGAFARRDEWRASLQPGAVVLKEDEYNDLQEMINSVLSHQDACNILKHGQAEQSGYFRHQETGIKSRVRPDFLHLQNMAFLDVKSTTDVRADQFKKAIWTYRYDIQLAMYAYGIELITGKPVEYNLILVVEKKAPFECALYLCDEALMTKGREDYSLAMERLKQCIDENIFDSYQKKIEPISLPEWVLRKKEVSNEY